MAADALETIAFWKYHPFCPNASLRSKAMGLGPPILALYRQLKLLEALDGIDSVVELSSQGVWCPDRRLLTGLFQAFGRPVPTPAASSASAFRRRQIPQSGMTRRLWSHWLLWLAKLRLLCRH